MYAEKYKVDLRQHISSKILRLLRRRQTMVRNEFYFHKYCV